MLLLFPIHTHTHTHTPTHPHPHTQDFVYPEGVALPIGGPKFASEHILIEVHYNNEELDGGIVDSSGLQFFYTTTEPKHRAGVLYMGVAVSPVMVVPPGQDRFIVTGECSPDCLDRVSCHVSSFQPNLHLKLTLLILLKLYTSLTARHFTSSVLRRLD